MNRKSLSDLKYWYGLEKRKPLVLRGARQVGKSTLVRLFCKENNLDLIEINFEKLKLRSLDEPNNIKVLLNEIEFIFEKKISANTLVFFDEIQKYPQIFQSLRYLYEETPQIAVIAAGSLLDHVLDAPIFDIPVGRIQYYHLGPMTFFEYLESHEEHSLLEQLNNFKEKNKFILNKLLERLKEFYFIGGMPEAIDTYLKSKSMRDVSLVHQSILQTYKDDFNKYSKKNQLELIEKVFDRLFNNLGKKIKYSEILKEIPSVKIKDCLDHLSKARLIHFCYHTSGSSLPLKSLVAEKVFKIYFLDVGLMNSAHGIRWDDLLRKDISDFNTGGIMAEQFAAQHLAYTKGGFYFPELFYWLRDKAKQKAELDFVIELNSEIVPIEIKSGELGHLKSLILFAKEKNITNTLRFDLNPNRPLTQNLIDEQDAKKVKLINLYLGQFEILKDFSFKN
jgi:predicted AAA+ superfamily ATPase